MDLQQNMLKLITDYNSTDRKVIKENYKRIMIINDIRPSDLMDLGFGKNNVYQWGNSAANNIPLFEQALQIAVEYEFNITEFIKPLE
jgi:hypothetical protein